MQKTKTKECPSCAMDIPAEAKVCPICSYEFPKQNKVLVVVAVLLIIVWLRWMFF